MSPVMEKISDLVSSINEKLNQLKSEIYDALSAREILGSTAIAHGLALPHCRIPYISDFIMELRKSIYGERNCRTLYISDFIMGIIVVPDGIACGALDRKACRVFVFTIAPQNNSNEYLKIMAELGSFLDSDEKIDKLAKAKNNVDLYDIFLKLWEEYLHQNMENL